ncbi:MAG: DUF4625 domain-containing protein [Sphingobacteriales bacterium JAD_PAG50586_3]|nr:MAG: DUF4625 domain-containing protein [Sphingobacteriales bacterium JAD_PAG50586_3]
METQNVGYICMMKFRYILMVLVVAALVTACRKDLNDDDKPIAEFIQPDTANLTFYDTIPFKVQFTDNKNLLSYRLALTYITSTTPNTDSAKVKPYNVTWIGNIDGGSDFTTDIKIHIADTALSGQYRAIINCIDESGNQSASDTVLLYIVNTTDTIKPEISVVYPAVNQQYNPTDSLNVLALATDPSNVIYYSVTVIDSVGTQKAFRENNLNTGGYSIDENIGINAFSSGTYNVIIFVRDAYFNATLTTIPIVIN